MWWKMKQKGASGDPLKNLSYHPKKEGESSKDFKKDPQPELHSGHILIDGWKR